MLIVGVALTVVTATASSTNVKGDQLYSVRESDATLACCVGYLFRCYADMFLAHPFLERALPMVATAHRVCCSDTQRPLVRLLGFSIQSRWRRIR